MIVSEEVIQKLVKGKVKSKDADDLDEKRDT